MRRLAACAAAILACACALAGGAGAIVYGTPDGDAHPAVGVVRFWDASGRYLERCSGTMLSPTVLLTAAHCTAGAATARVWLTSSAPSISEVEAGVGDPGRTGVPFTHAEWRGLAPPDTHDVGVVVLDEPVPGLSSFGRLPDVGRFDGLATRRGLQNQLFTILGYGLQGTRPEYVELVQRFVGTAWLVTASSAPTDGFNFQLTSDPGVAHGGGICLGDSGGPAFYGDTNVVVGVNSFLRRSDCFGGGFVHRVDLADESAWIRSFLG
jgi:trypsin